MTDYRKHTFPKMPRPAPIAADELSQAVHLDTQGAVIFPGGMMHPESFRFLAGEEAYQALLKRPRVQSEYTDEELSK